MTFSSLWDILSIIAIIALIISFFIGKNAVWGTLSLGLIIAIITGFLFKDDSGFNWLIFKKIVIVSIIVGAFFELLGRLISSRNFKNH